MNEQPMKSPVKKDGSFLSVGKTNITIFSDDEFFSDPIPMTFTPQLLAKPIASLK